jgi:hypothetical protein
MKTCKEKRLIRPGIIDLLPKGLISTVRHRIECTEKDDKDERTHFIEYWIMGKNVTVLRGFYMDSKADVESMERINEYLRKVQKESDIKQRRSEISMGKIILNA